MIKNNSQVILPKLPLLTELTEERWQELKNKVQKNNGELMLLVHPFFEGEHYIPNDSFLQPNQKYFQSVHDILNQSNIPVVILEQLTKADHLQEKYPEHLIIPTQRARPYSLISKHLEGKDANHRRLIKKLYDVGVKTLVIGGMYSYPEQMLGSAFYSPEEHNKIVKLEIKNLPKTKVSDDKPAITHGCAGLTYSDFLKSEKFNKVSWLYEAMHPEKPAYYKRK